MTKLETMTEWYERKYGEPLEYIEDLYADSTPKCNSSDKKLLYYSNFPNHML